MIYLNERHIERREEKRVLDEAYLSDSFELVTVTGPSGSGKTAMIREFCRDKRAVLFTASRTNIAINLSSFSKAVSKALYKGLRSLVRFTSVEEGMLFLKRMAVNRRLIVVIDDCDALFQSDPGTEGTLRELLSHDMQDANVVVVTVSRSATGLETIAGCRSIVLGNLPFSAVRDAYGDRYDDHDLVRLYAITGGSPGILRYIDPDRTINQNIDSVYLSPDSPMYRDPIHRLMSQVRSTEKYECILSALSKGPRQMGEIVEESGVSPSSACSTYLSSLIDLGMVRKDLPYGEKASRKGLYSITDPSFLFWFRFVHENRSLIEYRYSDDLYGMVVGEDDGYLPPVFRDICLQFIEENPAFFDMSVTRSGRWWGDAGEIDIVVGDLLTTMFCDCRYRDSPVGLSVLDSLKKKSASIKTIGTRKYAIFSKEGFAKDLTDYARRHSDVTLVSLRDICSF